MKLLDRFERRWQQTALYYLLPRLFRVCEVWELRDLALLAEAGVEEAILGAIELALGNREFVEATQSSIARAPYLNDSLRTHLHHFVEHAARREYVEASAPLWPGLEGAFWRVAYQFEVVTPERTDPEQPTKKLGFEAMVKRLDIEQGFKTLMTRAVYGTRGNPFRHGDAHGGERRQVLYGVAALAGWLEQFADVEVLDVLVKLSARALPRAIRQAKLLDPRGHGPIFKTSPSAGQMFGPTGEAAGTPSQAERSSRGSNVDH